MSGVIKTLAAKPWLSSEDGTGAPVDVRIFNLPREKVGLRFFLVVATSLFLLFIVGYRMRMIYADWVPVQEPLILWVNSGFLVLASIAFEWSKRAVAAGNEKSTRLAFYVGGVMSFLFITGQLAAWQQLSAMGHFVSSNPSSSFFYLLTGVHGLHLLGGLVAWARTVAKIQPGANLEAARMSVDLCTVYWHYLLVVWGVLFYLLLAS
jgi:cytochrome c oxidase subunit 3